MGEALRSQSYPVFRECLPGTVSDTGKYTVRFASTPEELDAIQRLRFDVFNLELGEGLEESFADQRDRDQFDPVCHHLMVIEKASGDVVGTYRIQTGPMAAHYEGFYSAAEYQLAQIPSDCLELAVETGRACVAKPFRTRQVLFLLWKGLAAYMVHNQKRFLFGCCSLTSQDPVEGERTMRFLEREGRLHPEFVVPAQPGWECVADEPVVLDPREKLELPPLFNIYMRFGAKVCGQPAIDRFFKTIDYLVLLDIEALAPAARAMFFR